MCKKGKVIKMIGMLCYKTIGAIKKLGIKTTVYCKVFKII